MLQTTRRWLAAHPNWALALVTVALLAPFLAKPFNMDDPLFIWTAHQIHSHPGDPFGFNVNWYGAPTPMWLVTKNPPLACYYLALAAGCFGWSEIGLHIAFLFPAVVVILGTRRLAGHFCRSASLAALATLFTPVFLVSSLTVMCDVLMLAFWVWAVALWVEGMNEDHPWKLTVSGLLIGLAALTKYYGVCLVPLLAAYSLIDKRRPGWWALRLLIPLVGLFFYQVATVLLYGHPLFASATGYAIEQKGISPASMATASSVALAFTGGCLAMAVFFAPVFWRATTLLKFAAVAGAIVAVYIWQADSLKRFGPSDGIGRSFMELQIFFWAAGGVCVLALAGADVMKRRDSKSWLLALWVIGTFVFTAFLNWIVNGRSILPMAPAVGILFARRWEQTVQIKAGNFALRQHAGKFAFAAGAILAVWVAWSDFALAQTARAEAQRVCEKYGGRTRALWFQGHWGFQYYMESLGASPLDTQNQAVKQGDLLVVPIDNSNVTKPENLDLSDREIFTVNGPRLFTTTSPKVGAGFYASLWGPLPFAFGRVLPERIVVLDVNGVHSTPAPTTNDH